MHHRLLLAVLARILELQRHELVGGSTIEINAIDSGHATFHVNWLSREINMDALFHDTNVSAQPVSTVSFGHMFCGQDHCHWTAQSHASKVYSGKHTATEVSGRLLPSKLSGHQPIGIGRHLSVHSVLGVYQILLYFSPTVLFLSSYEGAQAARHSPCLLGSNQVIVVVPIEPFKLGRILRTYWCRYENIA